MRRVSSVNRAGRFVSRKSFFFDKTRFELSKDKFTTNINWIGLSNLL